MCFNALYLRFVERPWMLKYSTNTKQNTKELLHCKIMRSTASFLCPGGLGKQSLEYVPNGFFKGNLGPGQLWGNWHPKKGSGAGA
jgi:hypothetical protein